jgi:hypothetical protein
MHIGTKPPSLKRALPPDPIANSRFANRPHSVYGCLAGMGKLLADRSVSLQWSMSAISFVEPLIADHRSQSCFVSRKRAFTSVPK